MDFIGLGEDRFLRKDANQSEQTKDAGYAVQNPAPKRGDDQWRKIGRPKGSEEDSGAPNILTGTVIISCFIQTSALPSRIELQGNDLTFFDDTRAVNNQVIGDSSRMVFTHASGKSGGVITQGFIFDKRASIFDTYDNVLSIYAVNDVGTNNWIFVGRNALLSDPQGETNAVIIAVKENSAAVNNPSSLNGIVSIEYQKDIGRFFHLYHGGNMSDIFGSGTGFASIIQGGGGGVAGIGYYQTSGTATLGIYMQGSTAVVFDKLLVPRVTSAYDIGTSSVKVRTIYVDSVVASSVSTGSLSVTSVITNDVQATSYVLLPSGVTWTAGAGTPEGHFSAVVGSLYSNTTGGATTSLYVKTSGTGDTGWTAK